MVRHIKWIVIDVDGTMTDGGIYYDGQGNEWKKFNTRDAAGIFAAREAGIKLIVLTGRRCAATEKRMQELKIDYLFQGIKEKEQFLVDFMQQNQIKKEEIGYIGDDMNDFGAMKRTGYIGCPSDSCPEVKKMADYISENKGGSGAVREIITHILQQRGEWDQVIRKIYCAGI